jgi:LuxR family maltose regulon positive regulatory protein
MPYSILTTKLNIPAPRPGYVSRLRLLEHLNTGLHRKLTLISAPAGYGKTTLVSDWLHHLQSRGDEENASGLKFSWLSLDPGDNDLVRFLTYFTSTINRIKDIDSSLGEAALGLLQSPQQPPWETFLISLINELAEVPGKMILVLDDYHAIEAEPVQEAIKFFIDNVPPQVHVVITTREDPLLPLSRLRARDHLTELRAADLRFNTREAGEFLTRVMGLQLTGAEIASLESRTEGWISGLQLAAISMQGKADTHQFIETFTGSQRLVIDYLVDEVLDQQPDELQAFMLQTSILELMNASLCDAITGQDNSQEILEHLESANLFVIALDEERCWYRYHHLFADLLRQRLKQHAGRPALDNRWDENHLHKRASKWFEQNGMEIEAFKHAAAANDIDRAAHLIEGEGLPLVFRGVLKPILNWLNSLPGSVLDSRPSLWVLYASALTMAGQPAGRVEEKLQAAEAALRGLDLDEETRDLIGRIADTRANLAIPEYQVETIMNQSRRALEYLHPDNLTYRTAASWKLGVAYELQGDLSAAEEAFTGAITISQLSGNIYIQALANTGLANIQLAKNNLYLAAESYQHVLQLVGDLPIPVGPHVHLCLARIFYEWNDLDTAQDHGQQSLHQAKPFVNKSDILVSSQVFLGRLKLAQGDIAGAKSILVQAEQIARQHNFAMRLPEIAAVRVQILLDQGSLGAASDLVQKYEIPTSQVRVILAHDDPSAALQVLEPLNQQATALNHPQEHSKVIILQVLALDAQGEHEQAEQLLAEALALGEPGGLIRSFVDEGQPMVQLLKRLSSRAIAHNYIRRLLEACSRDQRSPKPATGYQSDQSGLVEKLSKREIEVLQLISEGLTNQEIADRLYLSLNTVKVHTRNINGKLGVSNRTKAVARAKVLGILSPG